METQAICVNEGSLGAEIKCHTGDRGFQVPETPAKQAASKLAHIPTRSLEPQLWASSPIQWDGKACLPASLGCYEGQNHRFAKSSKYGPTGTTFLIDMAILRQGQTAMKLDFPPFVSVISQTGMKENGRGGGTQRGASNLLRNQTDTRFILTSTRRPTARVRTCSCPETM